MTPRLMCILAHPDDETLGVGGAIAKYASEGVDVSLVCATRGERGWKGPKDAYPGPQAVAQTRTHELRAAADVLGIRRIDFLDYLDAELDQADPAEAIAKIAALVREVKPDVIVTFGPDGAYGHPDHIAISQFATAATVAAATEGGASEATPTTAGAPTTAAAPPTPAAGAHRVAKLYYMADTQASLDAYQRAFGAFAKVVDGHTRTPMTWPEWAITTRIDVREHADTVWRAIACHRSQVDDARELLALPQETKHALFAEHTFYRAASLVNGGRTVERDLFEGLR